MFYDVLATAIDSAVRSQLDDYSRQVWRAHGSGTIADDQAQQLAELIQRRRGPSPYRTTMTSTPAMMPRYYIQRSPEQRSPDRRASIKRRREHAATGPLPPNLAATFTTGELAALKILADECLAHGGVSDRSRNEIGARAGVSQTVVKRAFRYAERDGLISVLRRPRSGRKHLTNIIRIVSTEWLAWLHKGRRKIYAVNACNRAKPDFPLPRGAQKDPPRSQVLRKADSERVDKTVEKRNRTGASRA